MDTQVEGLEGQPKVDRKNPDVTQREQPIVGLVMLQEMDQAVSKQGKRKLQGDTIYDPINSKSYKCTIKLNADGTLDLRAIQGVLYLDVIKLGAPSRASHRSIWTLGNRI